MAALESAITVLFAPQRFSNNYNFLPKSPDSVKLHASTSIPYSSSTIFSHNHKLHFSSSSSKSRTFCFALQEVTEAAIEEETTEPLNNVKVLCVFNLPWSLSAPEIKDLFAQCGTVINVDIIKNKQGKGKGYVFVTMDTGEEAQAAVDKFNGHEISGRVIRIEIAKRLKKPPPPAPPGPPPNDTRHVIYASNLAWKARSTHLKDIFTENFKEPVSARVVFQTADGGSAGYGFVSYHTKEEAEAAVSALEGKELMGRPLRVKISEKKVKKAESDEGKEQIAASEESVEQIGEEQIAASEGSVEQIGEEQIAASKESVEQIGEEQIAASEESVEQIGEEQIAASEESVEQIAESGEGDEKQVDNAQLEES